MNTFKGLNTMGCMFYTLYSFSPPAYDSSTKRNGIDKRLMPTVADDFFYFLKK